MQEVDQTRSGLVHFIYTVCAYFQLLLCFISAHTLSHPNLLWLITNPQVVIIRCSHDYLSQYGTFCVRLPVTWNTTDPRPSPVPAPPPPPPNEEPPVTEGAASTPLPAEESTTATRLQDTGVRRPRQTRGINIGPSFSLSLPSLKPPLSFYLSPQGSPMQPPPPPPSTILVFPG